MEHVTVTISRGLTQQLAGFKKPTPDETKNRPPPPSQSDRETLSYLKDKEEIRHAFQRSKGVNRLLLKREKSELKKIEAQAQDLLQHHALQQPHGDACRSHREAVESCCQSRSEDVLKCTSLIDAYASCAQQSFTNTSVS